MVSSAVVGRPLGHVEGPDKVSGRARYAGDIALPGLLWGRCLRSPYPHARIISIDAARASQFPGVRAVITGEDLPDRRIGRRILDMYPLAREKVRFAGEKVVAVAADTPDIAEEALLLIDVHYEELPAVFDASEAMKDSAPRIHADPASYPGAYLPIPEINNVVSRITFSNGDVEAGFAQADRIFEHTFHIPSVHQGYIEPHACVVRIDADGRLNFWMSNKAPFNMRDQISAALGIPKDRVRIHIVPLGGDFGGKGSMMDAIVGYYLAERSGRPVKMVMSYTEELTAGNPRHITSITMRSGVTNDGRFTARKATITFNAGGYGSFVPSAQVNLHGAAHAAGPYRIPNVAIEATRVYTNTVPTGHMRAPGAPQVVFAEESDTDMIACAMGIDPVEFRMRNALVEGDIAPLGEHWHDLMAQDTLRAAADAAAWSNPKSSNVGRGVSMYERAPGTGESTETLTIDADAQITLLTAVPDTGTGSYTILQQVIAEELQVPVDQISIQAGNTDTAAFDSGAGGSRVTHAAGRATQAAAIELRTALIDLAARVTNTSLEQVRLDGGVFVGESGSRLTLKELMVKAQEIEEAPITRQGSYAAPRGHGEVTSFAAQIAEVEVDVETGRVKVRRIVSAHDVGMVINPLTHQGQIEGGIVQGIGQSITEHLRIEDGIVINANLGDYKLPTIADIPELSTVLVETKQGPAPFQGKAIGELSNVAVPAAIANAVFDAVGVRITELPVTAEKVYSALRSREATE